MRISNEILVIGNGDVKKTVTYEDDPKLLGYVMDLQKFEALLNKDIIDGIITVKEKRLVGIEEETYEI